MAALKANGYFQHCYNQRNLTMTTPSKLALARETAAVIEADVRTRLGDCPVTPASIKQALIESVGTLMPPIDTSGIIVEPDPDKPGAIRVLVPADWMGWLSGDREKEA